MEVINDHWHYLDQLVRLRSGKLINATSATQPRSKSMAGHSLICAIPHQDPQQEPGRLVYTVDLTSGVFTVQSNSGQTTDLCEPSRNRQNPASTAKELPNCLWRNSRPRMWRLLASHADLNRIVVSFPAYRVTEALIGIACGRCLQHCGATPRAPAEEFGGSFIRFRGVL